MFTRKDIIKALESHEGEAEEAEIELKSSLKQKGSFFKKIWAPAEEAMNNVSLLFKRV